MCRDMYVETLREITDLLEETMAVHKSVRSSVLSTKEGIVVAAASKDDRMDPYVLATVNAALLWAGATTLKHIDRLAPTYLLHSTPIEQILTVLQPHYQLIVVVSRADDEGFNLIDSIPIFQSIATRMELVMAASGATKREFILEKVVESIPEITKAMLVTLDGLPVNSVGFENHIEIAGLIGSIFANGLTFSEKTESITINSDKISLFITKVDEQRLLVVALPSPRYVSLCERIKNLMKDVI
jgi:predicted regulator of Ras-like GTPase activity (Roadblock/LC7/MglB family)